MEEVMSLVERDLREALANLIGACDGGRRLTKPGCGAGGMTIDANIRAMQINGVDAWAVEEAREVLSRTPAPQ